MSDDEYIYDEYEDFDDFHDMLWDADPAPELADDLAERASYSPVYQDNPIEDLREHFSDWEYYSDDYFDDDPKLLNNDARSTSKHMPQPVKRGRKRKLSESQPEIKSKEKDALAACLRGTVWKSKTPDRVANFVIGIEQPVALRLNDTIMKSAYSRNRGFGRGRSNRDEAWANNLSLADMGLKTETSMTLTVGGEEGISEDDEDAQEVTSEVGNTIVSDEEAVKADTMIEEPNRVVVQTEAGPRDSQVDQSEIEEDSKMRKRRKVDSSPDTKGDDTPALPTPDASLSSEISEASQKGQGQTTKKHRDHDRDGDRVAISNRQQESKPGGAAVNGKEQAANRKRKLSVSDPSATASTSSSRAKRQASTNPAEVKRPLTAAASRPTRNRKKK